MDRRTYLATATGATLALAGCTELGGPGEDDDDHDDDDHEDDDVDTGNGENGDDENGDDENEEDETGDDDLVGTFDDFEDLDEWEAFQDIGAIEADTEEVYEGSQSARLIPDSDGQVRVRRELDDPIDISDVVPGIAMTAEDGGMVRLQLQDEDGDYVEYSQQVLSDMPLARHNFGPTRVRGDPDIENITILQIIRWFGNGEAEADLDEDDLEGNETDDEPEDEQLEEGDGGDESAGDQMWVDDFYFVPKPDQGKVMLQFHGGFESHFLEAYPRVSEYDFPATTFVPTGRLREDEAADGDRLTHDQVEELADAGWTIGAQPANGAQLQTVEPDMLEEVVTEPAEDLEDAGYDGARFFAFPGSQYTGDSYELVQETYDLAFAGQAPAQGYAANPHLCSTVSNPSAGEAESLLEWTAEHGGITSVAFYQLEDSDAIGGLEETLAQLDEHVDEDNLEVITPEEMADEYVYED
jgi:peptidoglycan/xylan/chitin deacetylase (PgdA/CDA1 family)